ncbi:MAG TPA: UPF0182 family protein [Ilumatobacteraceae bacterium]|nr:UPF0182 family protein [Ilumatobacteraceae bacterium]
MRRPTDLPRRRAFGRLSGRIVLIVVAVLLFALIIFGRALARFYVDYLWHDSLGRSDVFWGVLWTKIGLFLTFLVVFLVLAGLNLYIADRTAPKAFPANVHPYVERFHEVFGHRLRLVRYGTAAVLALFLALPAAGHWQDWMLFRNSTSFGVEDAQFSTDVGFYVFELPFISFAIDWLFAAMVVVLLLTLAAHLLNGGVLFASSTPSVRASTKAHLAVLLAVLATLKAADYWLTRYQLTNERRGFVQGATYAVVKAQLPALMLLVLIALLTAALFLSTIRTNRWRVPLVASALWLVVLLIGGLIFPALVQSLVVRPNQADREAPYIERNVIATRQAMGLGDVVVEPITFGTLTASEIESDLAPLRDVRLLNPVEMKSRFRVDEGQVAGLAIDDLDVDRYELEGQSEEVLIAARELDLAGSANQSWQGRHLVNTRGCGVVMAPASRVTQTDRPDYQDVELTRPELYFSPSLTSYAIARTDEAERGCGDDTVYEGTRGVRMSSFARRAAFALAFLDYNVVGSGAINPDSQMLWVRDVRDRVAKLAPFLSFDGDPYPVVIDGAVTWVLDGYTSTGNFPYAQRIGNVELTTNSGIPRNANYVRNSVKATVDAYDGSVTFYAADEVDPILQAWRSAFPNLFTPIDEMPAQLRDHLRYPEDLFRVQTDLYSKYQLAPENFFQREGAWSVAQAPNVAPRISSSSLTGDAEEEIVATEFATESQAARFVPYYTLFRNRVTGRNEFVLLRPFVPFSRDDLRTELQAFMTASSDPQSYGRLTAYVVEGELPEGPLRVSSQAESEPLISREISLQDNEESGTQVRFGDMQLVPISDGLVFVRPFYIEVQQQGGQIPLVTEYRFVIVSYNEEAVHATTLSEAFASLFPGFDADVGDRVPDPAGEEAPDDSVPDESVPDDTGDDVDPDRPPLDDGATAAQLLAEAEALFTEAEAGLRVDGDLGAYQQRVDEARELIARALELLD